MHRTAPTTRNHPVQNVSGVEVEVKAGLRSWLWRLNGFCRYASKIG